MNTNQLKKFAQQARIKLIDQIKAKLEFVLTNDTPELREKSEQVKKLKEELVKTKKEQLIDKVAYTWFNRFMALRFMDVNDYQPLGVKIITPKDGYTLPEILDDAKQGQISDDLKVNRERISDLIDGKIPSANGQNEAYRELLIGACNHLHQILPFLFERINDYTELLLPDDLTSELSIIQDIRDGMSAEDCAEVEVIGWLYQFYISEKKDEVFASKSAVKKEDIPAATQLFTPRWIVEYMVQNTVGKLWLQNRPNSKLREHMPYFIESPSVTSDDYLKVNSVEEITLLDQACGSGHILVYGFDLLYKIYEEEGYNINEIPELIIKNNLFGFEIDERASQLAGLALLLKARSYYRRFFKKEVEPNITNYKDLNITIDEAKEALNQIGYKVTDELIYDITQMQQATNFGSLIIPRTDNTELIYLAEKIKSKKNNSDVFLKYQLQELSIIIEQLISLSYEYTCLVANPPYMGGGKMNSDLTNFVKITYPDAKADLITCFVERGLKHLPKHGYSGLVTMESWMFLSSFENFRKKLLENTSIHSLSHFGWHIMRIAFGTVSFIIENNKPKNDFRGVYNYMEYDNIEKDLERPIEFPLKNERFKIANQKDFEKIPGSPIGYWLSNNAINTLERFHSIDEIASPRTGMTTSDNDRFVRFWSEISKNKIYFYAIDKVDARNSKCKWFPYNKGGGYRKWFGLNQCVINWENDGDEISNLKDSNGKKLASIRAREFYFKEGVSYSSITSSNFSARFVNKGCLFDSGGSTIFTNNDKITFNVLGILNSKILPVYMSVFNSTLNFQPGDIARIPFPNNDKLIDITIIKSTIEISKNDWDSRELSWGFKMNELIIHKSQDIEETYELFKCYWKNKFIQLHKNEEEINSQFIEIFGLQDEITSYISLEDISILKEETIIDNGQLVFKADEVFAQFMSYAVGCMFGRYSLDKEGLILANQGETLEDYLKKVALSEAELTFTPDDDNVIPVLDDEWFEDDIIGRFYAFLKASFGKENFDKNLAFVEECLGKNVRKYFVKDFYADHIKRYKKRPIYWMFSSPKGSFNVLIYMHRYTPDTLNKILNNYLIQYREKLNTRIEHHEHIIVTGTSAEQTRAQKEKDKLKLVILELVDYERDVLRPLAIERISIDLDDGVLVNYNKFGKAIKDVAGLNDAKTKKKVREFDWIDINEIR
jgi:type II restriction/modification system DNA methylase subunit YeeA